MTIRSMTGFGRHSVNSEKVNVSVELKSVNHRFAEFHIRLPREWMFLEDEVRRILASHVQRGRVDVFLNVEVATGFADVQVNWDLLDSLIDAERTLARRLDCDVRTEEVRDWLKYPGVLHVAEQKLDEEEMAGVVRNVVHEALTRLVEMRIAEGNRIAENFVDKLVRVEAQVTFVQSYESQAITAKTERLQARFASLLVDVDPERFAQEVVLLVDRSAVDEEIVRLTSHIEAFREALDAGEPIGRRLDFVVQEMLREVNTIGSKSADARIAQAVVEMKVLVEQLREQVQNVE